MNRSQISRGKLNRNFSRRTFLRGVGVTMALPWLGSLPGFGETASSSWPMSRVSRWAFPKRLAVMFMAAALTLLQWWPKGEGADMTFSKSLEPLEPLETKGQRYQRFVQ